MPTSAKLFIAAGGLAALAAVALGAFGAHALKSRMSAKMLAVWHTGIEYQVYHALGLLAVGLLAQQRPQSVLLEWSGWLMLARILLFSGSLYALALTGVRSLRDHTDWRSGVSRRLGLVRGSRAAGLSTSQTERASESPA